jgi:hypothetical protein
MPITHNPKLTKVQFEAWLVASKAPAKTAPAKAAPVKAAPVKAPAAASTSVATSASADERLHCLNDIPGFNSLTQPVKEQVSKDVKAEAKVSGKLVGPITGWDDAAWAVVEPIAMRKVLEELAKRPAPRPHTGGGHPHHKAGGHPHHKGGKKGGH